MAGECVEAQVGLLEDLIERCCGVRDRGGEGVVCGRGGTPRRD